MSDLITRLEEAAEGSRELDAEISQALMFPTMLRWGDHHWRRGHVGGWTTLPSFTTSIDDAIALAERVLPEINCIGFDKTPSGVEAYVSRNNVDSGHWVVTSEHPSSPALALCLAVLRATPETT